MEESVTVMPHNQKVQQERTQGAQTPTRAPVSQSNSKHRPGGARIPKRLQHEIVMVLKKNGYRSAHTQEKVAPATREKREAVIREFFGRLYFLKYKITTIHNIRQTHLVAVFKSFEAQGLAPSTIQNKLSVMRIFCEWIDKHGMVHDSSEYVQDTASVCRSTAAKDGK